MIPDKTQRLDTTDATVETPVIKEQRLGFLSHIPLPAVIAAVLVIVTSFLLSSRLGITGSLIGAVIGVAVVVVVTRAYPTRFGNIEDDPYGYSADMQSWQESGQATGEMSAVDNTLVRPLAMDVHTEQDATSQLAGTRLAPEEMLEEVARQRTKTLMRRTFIAAILAALLALAGYAALVSVATQGRGIGPTSIKRPVKQEQTVTEQEAATETQDTAAADSTTAAEPSAETEATEEPEAEVTPVPREQGPQETTEDTAAPETPSEPAETQPDESEPAPEAEPTEPETPAETPEAEPTADTDTSSATAEG